MNRIVRRFLRVLLVAALLAALIDFPLPAPARPRERIHVIDVSPSVRSGKYSFREADRLARHDLRRQPGSILHLDAGTRVADEPPSGPGDPVTDLAAGIDRALWLKADDIVLHTDGRATRPGLEEALFRAATAGVPVHVVPTGPVEPDDARIVSLRAPAEAAEKESFSLRVTVSSTRNRTVSVRLGEKTERLTLPAGFSKSCAFPCTGPGLRTVVLEPKDEFPENNRATLDILPPSTGDRVLVLCENPSSAAGKYLGERAEVSRTYVSPFLHAAVVIEDYPADRFNQAQKEELVRYVKLMGGGLFFLGGPRALGPGGYADTPLAPLLPLSPYPDERVGIIVALDVSASMGKELPGQTGTKFQSAMSAIERLVRSAKDFGEIRIIAFSGKAEAVPIESLRTTHPSGPTLLLPALREAARVLDTLKTPRKRILMITDGETRESEEDLLREVESLGIPLHLLATGEKKEFEVLKKLGPCEMISDQGRLWEKLREAFSQANELVLSPKEAPVPHAAPFTRIRGWVPPGRINRTTLQRGATLLLSVDGHPILARKGLVMAAAFGFSGDWAGEWAGNEFPSELMHRAVEEIASKQSDGRRLRIRREGKEFVVESTGTPVDTFTWWVEPPESGRQEEERTLSARQIGTSLYEGRLQWDGAGTLYVRAGDAKGRLTVPVPSEFRTTGIDPGALQKIADATGGSLLDSFESLSGLPLETPSAPVPGRPWFLMIALFAFLAETAVRALWRK